MTINFFLQSRDFGGAEKFAKDLLVELARTGARTYLYTSNSVVLEQLATQEKVKLEKIPVYLDFVGNRKGLLKSFLLTPLAVIYYWQTLKKIKKRPSSQIIICSGFSEKILLAPLANSLGLPIFFIEYGPLEPLFKKLYGIPKTLYSFAKKFAHKVIVSSNKTKQALSDIFPKEKLALIRCGSPDLLQNNSYAEQQKHTVSVISRLEPGKGQDLAIKAWQMIKNKPKEASLEIIGRGSFAPTLHKLAKNDKSIKFLAYVAKVEKFLATSSIALCPSVWELEGFGLVVTEAMALGKPIIAFNRAPYNELVKNNHSALLAEDGDVNDLAQKIEQLLFDHSLQKKLGRNARADFLAKFQIAKVAKNYLKVLQN